MAIVYQATNLINGKRYIGRTGHSLGSRIAQHFNAAGRLRTGHFHNALLKYGKESFRWSVLLECDAVDVSKHEVRLIFHLKPEYNGKRRSSGKPTVDRWMRPHMPVDWTKDGEEWRDIAGFEGCYQISSFGRVRGLYRKFRCRNGQYGIRYPAILKLQKKKRSNHLCVSLAKGCTKKTCLVHQLVAAAFIGPRPDGLSVLHRDDVADHNRPENLYYGTQQQNVADRCRNGKCARGNRNPRSKLTEEAVVFIKSNAQKLGQREMARMMKVSHTSIQQVLSGVSWSHVVVN